MQLIQQEDGFLSSWQYRWETEAPKQNEFSPRQQTWARHLQGWVMRSRTVSMLELGCLLSLAAGEMSAATKSSDK